MSRRQFGLIALACASLAVAAGCNRQKSSNREVWANVDGVPIYRDQVERYYRGRMSEGGTNPSPQEALSLKLNILGELINNQILLAHAAHAQVTVSEADIDTQVAKLKSPYSEEEFQKKLNEQGLSAVDFREQVRDGIIINKLINKEIASRIATTDAEISDYYEHNKASFDAPETEYHLAQIEVTPFAGPPAHKDDAAKNMAASERKAEALYARLQRGDDFATVAQQYSQDAKTAPGGGDMGFIPASSLESNPQLKRAIASLKVGEISGILRSPSGFHIIKLLGRADPGQMKLSNPQVESTIRRTLMGEKEELLKAAYIEELRDHAKVVNFLAEQITAAGPDDKSLQ
ncbi:MAG TPA: peptidylprolyl isomerase [Terriglobia bacterium]|nr:peptidylprolyl isomerase [Terriglobia bacterium]